MRQSRLPVVLSVLGALALIDTVLVGLAIGPASTDSQWPGLLNCIRIYHWQSIAILTVAGTAIAIWTVLLSRDRTSAVDLHQMADELAVAVSSNWKYETDRWHVLDPYPLAVRWVAGDLGLLDDWAAIVRMAEGWPTGLRSESAGWLPGPEKLAGGDDDLVGLLDKIPTGRLVVLGSRGAGKTILLIRTVLRLLEPARRQHGGPVPFLLPMASWNPAEEDLISWMAGWMATSWEPLSRRARPDSETTIARALLEAGLVIPVLDGLDEMARELRSLAITQLNKTAHIRRLILSCRTDEYLTAVLPAPGVEIRLAGAAGIELCPLHAKEVADYLKRSAGGPAGAARWSPIIAAMTIDPPPPVAQALTTPLMAALARAIYNPPPEETLMAGRPNPAELLDQRSFPDADAIEDHLYDRFIPACYLPHPNKNHPSRKFSWTPEQAQKWLTFLARYLEDPDPERRTTDLMWWRLDEALPSRRVTLAVAVTLGIVAAVTYPFVGFGPGVLTGITAGLLGRRWIRSGRDRIARSLTGSLIGGQLGTFVMVPVIGFGPHVGISWFIASGLGVGLAVAPVGRFKPGLVGGFVGAIVAFWYEHASSSQSLRTVIGPGSHVLNGLGCALAVYLCAELLGRPEPARGMRWSWLWFGCGASVGAATGFTVGFQQGLSVGLVTGLVLAIVGALTGLVGEPVATDLKRTADPVAVLRRDRSSFLASWLAVGTALGLGTGLQTAYGFNAAGQPNNVVVAVLVGIANLLVPAIGFAFIQATWGKYTGARLLLAASRQLPWRLTKFLQDAAVNRGVLRQFGAVYQFRHAEIQRHLAALTRTDGGDIMGHDEM